MGTEIDIERIDAEWLEKQGEVTVAGLVALSGLTEAELRELVEYGALTPVDPDAGEWLFAAPCVITVRTASRLRHDFELDAPGLALALSLIERVDRLEAELRRLRVLIPHRSY